MAHFGRRILGLALCALLAAGVAAMGPAGAGEAIIPAAEAWIRATETRDPLRLVVGGRPMALHLSEHRALFAPGAEIRDGGGRALDVSAIRPLAGSVAGVPGSWVRVTLGGETITGLIWAPGFGLISLAPGADGRIVAVTGEQVAASLTARGIDTTIEPAEVEAAEDCDSLMWEPQVAAPTSLLEEDELRTFNVAFAVDGTFEANHEDWATLATGFVNATDGLFRSSFDIRIRIEHLIAIPDENVPGTTTIAMLDSLQDHYGATYPDLVRDNVHLFTGRVPTNAAGQVNCVGSVKRTTVSYSVSQGDPGGPYDFGSGAISLLPDGAMKILAHELAHTLSAHHHYANCAESMPGFDPLKTLDLCTVMINDWGLIQPVFSSLSRLTVRGWSDYYDV